MGGEAKNISQRNYKGMWTKILEIGRKLGKKCSFNAKLHAQKQVTIAVSYMCQQTLNDRLCNRGNFTLSKKKKKKAMEVKHADCDSILSKICSY